jgi:hypothetical protein
LLSSPSIALVIPGFGLAFLKDWWTFASESIRVAIVTGFSFRAIH